MTFLLEDYMLIPEMWEHRVNKVMHIGGKKSVAFEIVCT